MLGAVYWFLCFSLQCPVAFQHTADNVAFSLEVLASRRVSDDDQVVGGDSTQHFTSELIVVAIVDIKIRGELRKY